MTNIERLVVEPGDSYKFVMDDGNLAAGAVMTIDGTKLGPSDKLTIDG